MTVKTKSAGIFLQRTNNLKCFQKRNECALVLITQSRLVLRWIQHVGAKIVPAVDDQVGTLAQVEKQVSDGREILFPLILGLALGIFQERLGATEEVQNLLVAL